MSKVEKKYDRRALRKKIQNFINDSIKIEHGTELTQKQFIYESGLDSFGYLVLWTDLCSPEIGANFSIEELKLIDNKKLTLKKMIDMVEKKIIKNQVKKNEDKII